MTHPSGTMQQAAGLTGSIAGVPIDRTTPTATEAARGLEALALQWFAQMRSGDIDRTQLAEEYSAHLTDQAVQGMSRYLKTYEYGASPLHARVLKSSAAGAQTFHVVKIAFPRGDAASLMFGFNTDGKITGISLLSMAGD